MIGEGDLLVAKYIPERTQNGYLARISIELLRESGEKRELDYTYPRSLPRGMTHSLRKSSFTNLEGKARVSHGCRAAELEPSPPARTPGWHRHRNRRAVEPSVRGRDFDLGGVNLKRQSQRPTAFEAQLNRLADVRQRLFFGGSLGNAARQRRAFRDYKSVLAPLKGHYELHQVHDRAAPVEKQPRVSGTPAGSTQRRSSQAHAVRRISSRMS